MASAIIGAGYFPREVPPPFRTSQLAAYVDATGLSAINAGAGSGWTRPVLHNLARPGGLRRVLSIPNPIHFLRLAEIIEAKWSLDLRPLLEGTTLATSRPVPSAGPRSFVPQVAATDVSQRRALSRSGARFLLQADVLNFYPSIYTHSIPWALHEKSAAKAAKNDITFAGNQIDKAVREGQDGQTMGLPIGPDTSWVVAECVLARIEQSLCAKIDGLRGHRFNDDFELSFGSLADAERALSHLQEILAEYELSLNPRKTKILDLPQAVESSGIADLRRWEFRIHPKAQRSDIIAYFDRTASLIREDPGGSSASYAVARLKGEHFDASVWPLLEALLLQLLVAEPSCASHVAATLSALVGGGYKMSGAALSSAVERLAVRHSPMGHGSEVAWALWMSIANGVPITQATADAVAAMDDCLVALLSLHAKTHSLVAGSLNTTRWEQAMTSEELRGPRWLLSYEARIKGWLPSKNTADHVADDAFFSKLKEASVSFYDSQALTLKVTPTSPLSMGGGGGMLNYLGL